MKHNRIFLDTNILIYLLEGNEELREILGDKIWYISFISEMELLLKPHITEAETKAINTLLQECFIIDMNNGIKQIAIESGQKFNLKLADSIIYASARAINITFLTADKIFKRINTDDLNLLIYEK